MLDAGQPGSLQGVLRLGGIAEQRQGVAVQPGLVGLIEQDEAGLVLGRFQASQQRGKPGVSPPEMGFY